MSVCCYAVLDGRWDGRYSVFVMLFLMEDKIEDISLCLHYCKIEDVSLLFRNCSGLKILARFKPLAFVLSARERGRQTDKQRDLERGQGADMTRVNTIEFGRVVLSQPGISHGNEDSHGNENRKIFFHSNKKKPKTDKHTCFFYEN